MTQLCALSYILPEANKYLSKKSIEHLTIEPLINPSNEGLLLMNSLNGFLTDDRTKNGSNTSVQTLKPWLQKPHAFWRN